MNDEEIYELCSDYFTILLDKYYTYGYYKSFKGHLDNRYEFRYLKPYSKYLEKVAINIFYGQGNLIFNNAIKEDFITFLRNYPNKQKDTFLKKVKRNIIIDSIC